MIQFTHPTVSMLGAEHIYLFTFNRINVDRIIAFVAIEKLFRIGWSIGNTGDKIVCRRYIYWFVPV